MCLGCMQFCGEVALCSALCYLCYNIQEVCVCGTTVRVRGEEFYIRQNDGLLIFKLIWWF